MSTNVSEPYFFSRLQFVLVIIFFGNASDQTCRNFHLLDEYGNLPYVALFLSLLEINAYCPLNRSTVSMSRPVFEPAFCLLKRAPWLNQQYYSQFTCSPKEVLFDTCPFLFMK